jgi:hypothetical protein|nr:MAG TPA: hypothetical protein [Caudoviricetes sp.]
MNQIEKEKFRNIFASKVNSDLEGMIVGSKSDWEELTFVYDIPFKDECLENENEDKLLQAELWIIFKFDIRERSGCRVIIEKHLLHATKSEHLLTFSIDCKDLDLPENIQYSDYISDIVQWVKEAYNLVIAKSSYL